MKKLNKVFVLVLAVIMTLAMSASVFAQDKAYTGTDKGNGSITINNPANGETYTLYKLFDATVSADGKISYKGTVPAGLANFFEADDNGNISPKAAIADQTAADGTIISTKMTDALKTALETWASSADEVIHEVSNGDPELKFTDLPYGYYVMTTTHKDDKAGKALISVTSTKPDAVINDKNINEPSADKQADGTSYSVGDTITYTATFDAPNYMTKQTADKNDVESEQVVSYTISDTLPDFLSDVRVTKVEIKQPGVGTNVELSPVPQFENKKFVVPWVNETVPTTDHKYTSTYKAGSQIIVTYTAKLTRKANVGADNENTVSIMPNVDRGNGGEPYQEEDEWNDSWSVTTHAAALQKTDGSKNLAGAKFKFKGLTATGAGGVYTVVSYDPNAAEGSGTELECDADGKLVIIGIADGITLVGKETKAPEGFNIMTEPFDLPTVTMATTTTTTWGSRVVYYDEDGNVIKEESSSGTKVTTDPGDYSSVSDIPASAIVKVVNKPGVELPGTGGIGTTIFYILGSLLVIGCGIVLISRKRMENNK